MKKLILLVCFLFVTSQSYSQPLFVENFDYPVPTILSTTVPWNVASAGINPILVDIPGGLSFPLYAGSGVGNAVTLLTSGEDDSASLSSVQTSGSVYSSFMLSVASAQTAGDYFFALATTGNAFDSRIYIRPDGLSGFNIGIQKAATGPPDYAPASYSFLTTYLVVAKYTFVAGAGNDEVSLFVFDASSPPPTVEPTPTAGPFIQGGTDATNLSRVIIRQGSATASPQVIIDGIYVDDSWNDAVLPVELASFTSVINKRDVTLNWITASESNNSGFEIERASNNVWSKVGSVAGNGTTTSSSSYSYTDRGLETGNYSYRLKQIDFNGNFEYFNLSNEINIGIPSRYELSQNYPNPFNPTTNINFDIPTDGNVSIKLFDMSGKEVATIVNEVKTAGYYSVNFNASGLSSGIYFYNISANNFTATKKMTLLK